MISKKRLRRRLAAERRSKKRWRRLYFEARDREHGYLEHILGSFPSSTLR